MSIKIAIGIPTNRGVQPDTVKSVLEMIHHSDYEFVNLIATEGYTISENRAWLIAQARKVSCDYILFIDDDMTFPPDALDTLISNKKPIVGVLSNSRKLPLQPTIQLLDGSVPKYGQSPLKPFRVKAVGGGVLLIDLKIFDNLEQPYFGMKTHPNGYTLMGEDSWFCERAEKAGYEIWCDPRIKIGHIGQYIY